MSKLKGRFAPSPTGHIHLGNVWIALLTYLSVRQQQGTFVIRLEDIDKQRSKQSLGEELLDDLEWLGFTWDEGPRVSKDSNRYWQSNRYDLYEAQLQAFANKGLVYPCFCNRARLQNISSAPHLGEAKHHYDGHCRNNLTENDILNLSQSKAPSWRLKVESSDIKFTDLWQGLQVTKLVAGKDDFVLKRADGMFAYNLAVVLDDIDMGITEIIRGRDLLDTTPMHLYLYNLLGVQPPQYMHAPLLVDANGIRLSKRQKAITVCELKASGLSKEEILGRLALQGGLISYKQTKSGKISLEELVNCDLTYSQMSQKDICIK